MKAASDDGFSELSIGLTASRLNSDVDFFRLLGKKQTIILAKTDWTRINVTRLGC